MTYESIKLCERNKEYKFESNKSINLFEGKIQNKCLEEEFNRN